MHVCGLIALPGGTRLSLPLCRRCASCWFFRGFPGGTQREGRKVGVRGRKTWDDGFLPRDGHARRESGAGLLGADLRFCGFTELRQARPVILALPLPEDAFAEGERRPRSVPGLVVVVGMAVVIGGFRGLRQL